MHAKPRNRYATPEIVKQILEEGRKKRGISSSHDFRISAVTNELIPKSLPKKSGSTVLISPGFPPNEEEVNLILEREDADIYSFKRWFPTFKFYISQIVVFCERNKLYTYQIKPTDKKDSGEFVLLKVEDLEQQPGVAARTSKTGGGSKSSYSR